MEEKLKQFFFDVNYLAKVSKYQLSGTNNLKEIYFFLLKLRYDKPLCIPEIERITKLYLLNPDFTNYLNKF